jgi:chemotaxis protein MotB
VGACLIAAGLWSMLLTGGCVSKAEFEEARAACRRANEELLNAQKLHNAALAENKKLQADLTERDALLRAKQDEIGLLVKAKDDLQASFDQLKEAYDKLAAQPPPRFEEVRLPAQVDKALRQLADDNADLVEYLPKYGMVKFKSDPTFDKGSAQVRADAVTALNRLAEIINGPAAREFHIYVAGHTDDIPLKKPDTIRKHGTNWGLSCHRAVAVVQVLFAAGVDQKRMGAMGFSKHHPVAPNRPGNRGNPVNRRVEIWIIPRDRFLTVSAAAGSAVEVVE